MISKIKEIFEWRQLLFNLALKDLKIKYRRATGGFGWMFITPLVQAGIFLIIFKFLFKIKIENYHLFLLSGLFPWSYLKASIDGAANSIVANSNLIKKTYFPREILPIAGILTNFVTFFISLFILFLFCFFLIKKPLSTILWLPLLLLTQTIFIIGLSLFISSLNACFREVSFIINTFLLIWFYATPIVYSNDMAKNLLPNWVFRIYMINPMMGIIDSYHRLFVFGEPPNITFFISSFIFSFIMLILGYKVFKKYEDIFVDII